MPGGELLPEHFDAFLEEAGTIDRVLLLTGPADVHARSQQMLERRRDSLENGSVDSNILAFDFQLDTFVELGHGASHEPAKSLHLLGERQKPGAHQPLLQILADPGLLGQDIVGLTRNVTENVFDAA